MTLKYLFLISIFLFVGKNIYTQNQPPFDYNIKDAETYPSGLKVVIIEEGDGFKPKKGEKIVVHYYGVFENGKVFDSSYERNKPFEIGLGKVIKGWEEAFMKLKEGTKAVLIIPPDLAYGNKKMGNNIPPNSTLIFHIKFIKINNYRQ